MATTTSQIRSIVGDLYTLVTAQAGLDGVTVFKYAASPRELEPLDEYIVLATRISGTQEFPAATKYLKYDTFTLFGEIWLSQPGAGDAIADDAHERAEELLAEIEAVLQSDPSLGRANTEAELTSYTHTYGAGEDDRLHLLAFEIECRARMVST